MFFFFFFLLFIVYCLCVQVFDQCDVEKKGYLSREDVKVAVVMLFGYKPSKVNPAIAARGRHCADYNMTHSTCWAVSFYLFIYFNKTIVS